MDNAAVGRQSLAHLGQTSGEDPAAVRRVHLRRAFALVVREAGGCAGGRRVECVRGGGQKGRTERAGRWHGSGGEAFASQI